MAPTLVKVLSWPPFTMEPLTFRLCSHSCKGKHLSEDCRATLNPPTTGNTHLLSAFSRMCVYRYHISVPGCEIVRIREADDDIVTPQAPVVRNALDAKKLPSNKQLLNKEDLYGSKSDFIGRLKKQLIFREVSFKRLILLQRFRDQRNKWIDGQKCISLSLYVFEQIFGINQKDSCDLLTFVWNTLYFKNRRV